MNQPRQLLVIGHNHFDPMWRRCFLADALYDGVVVKPYADVEELVLSGWLGLAERGYAFTEGQALVLREWLRRDPTRLPALRREIARGRFAPVQGGEVVPDSNMSSAEGLVRNFLVAQPFWRELGVEDHPGLEIAWLEDAFGNSANYPQLLRGVGCTVAAKLLYRSCPTEVWTGIDGTSLPVLDHIPNRSLNSWVKYPPCPACAGRGCLACAGRGMVFPPVLDRAGAEAAFREALAAAPPGGDPPYVVVGGEELLPEVAVADAVDALAAAGRPVRWGTWADVWVRQRERLLALAAAADGTPTPELNPAQPGCMVTRRLAKARTRAIAYRLVEAESCLADAAWRAGRPQAPPAEFQTAWRHVAFAQFHDAITGTAIDSAYREMMGFLDSAEAVAARHLPPPAVAASPPAWCPHPGGEDSIRLGSLDVRFDRVGILAVAVGGRELLSARPMDWARATPAWRVGELTLESDFGDAWGKRIQAVTEARGLGEFNESVEVAACGLRWRGRYRGGHRKVRALSWTIEVRASDDGQRLDFAVEVDWDTESKRLRAVFPVASADPAWLGEIPFGFIERRFDPARMDYSHWNAQQNEMPTLHWAQHRLGDGSAVALIGEGLPCVRWQPGCFDVSLLRSPESELSIVETAHYEFWDTDGQRDAGRHSLRWSLWPAAVAQTPDELTRLGYAMNRPGMVEPPFAIAGPVLVSAWKPAEDGSCWILRLQETSGRGGEVVLDFVEEREVVPCDLLERPGRAGSIGSPARGRRWSAALQRHGIMTLRIR